MRAHASSPPGSSSAPGSAPPNRDATTTSGSPEDTEPGKSESSSSSQDEGFLPSPPVLAAELGAIPTTRLPEPAGEATTTGSPSEAKTYGDGTAAGAVLSALEPFVGEGTRLHSLARIVRKVTGEAASSIAASERHVSTPSLFSPISTEDSPRGFSPGSRRAEEARPATSPLIGTYVVESPSETYATIEAKFGMTSKELQDMNRLVVTRSASPYPGQALRVRLSPSSAPQVLARTPPRPPLPESPSGMRVQDYTIQRGDTISGIELKFDMKSGSLRRLNNGHGVFALVPGRVVRVKLQPVAREAGPAASSSEASPAAAAFSVSPSGATKSAVPPVQRPAVAWSSVVGDRVRGVFTVSIASGFTSFVPEDGSPLEARHFSIDRIDILSCASVFSSSHPDHPLVRETPAVFDLATSALDREGDLPLPSSPPPRLLQIVWRNEDLGEDREEDQLFLLMASDGDARDVVEAVYACRPRARKRSLTHGAESYSLASLTRSAASSELEESRETEEGGSERARREREVSARPSHHPAPPRPVLLPGFRPHVSRLLRSETHVLEIVQHLPPRLRQAGAWELIYDFDTSGVSLFELYAAARSRRDTILVFSSLDGSDQILGCYASEEWDPTARHDNAFYGSGEAFVFATTLATPGEDPEPRLICYPWAGKDDWIQSCSSAHLGCGGGSGSFALCLDADLQMATSGPCTTFAGLETKGLGASPSFRVGYLELWAIDSSPLASSSSSFLP